MDNSVCAARTCYTPCWIWIKICRFYNHLIEIFFEKLGELVGKHPLKTTVICFLIMAALASGFVFVEMENRSEKLYIPQKSESITNLNKAREYGFYRASRLTEVILLNGTDGNVLTKDCLQDALSLHNKITNITGYTKLCLPIGNNPETSSSDCLTRNVLKFFDYDSNNLENISFKLNTVELTKGVRLDGVLGKISRNSLGNITSAQAIRLVYFIKGTYLGDDVAEETINWEKEFLDQMKESKDQKCGPVFYTTGRSLDDAISESSLSDTKLISITFMVMIGFACLMLGKYRNPLTGHGLLAMGGVMCVGFGIMTALGLAMFCKVPFISIVGILPFLIIGVGIDDMFIIVDELDRSHPDQPIPERLSKVMKHVGPAITMTTLTDLLAFAVGTSSKFPSVVHFCTYAALSIFFAFSFLATMFVAFMVYDCRRMNAGRRDMVPCLKVPPPSAGKQRWDEPLPQTSNKIMERWGKMLLKPFTKVFVVVLSISLLGFGIYGSTFINEEFDRKDLAKDGSDYVRFLNTLEEYFNEDIKVDVILEPGLNYSDPTTQVNIASLSNIIRSNRYYRSKIISWFDEFQKWTKKNNGSETFMISLQHFLGRYPRFRSDISFSKDNKTISASRFHSFIKRSSSSVTLRNAMTSLRSDLSEKSDLAVFSNAWAFIFFEQFVLTLPETIRNLVCAAAAILIITTLFLVNPLVVFCVLVSFASLIFELLGLMYVWNVSLNSISMINLVMAIGFAVDYSAHVAHYFVFSPKTTPEDKVIDSLQTMGASVFMGGFSTFLGMIVTAFASAEIFRIFFKMFFGIVVLGLLHGLCFLPVWLSIICRHNFDVSLNTQNENTSAVNPATISPSNFSHEGATNNGGIDMNGINQPTCNGAQIATGSSPKKNIFSSSRINPGFDPSTDERSNKNSSDINFVAGNIEDNIASVDTKL